MRRVWKCLLVVALAGCALRPTYRALVTPATAGPTALFQVVDRLSGAPLPGVKVELSEGKNRYSTTSAADGTFSLPVDKKYLDENPLLVLTAPAGSAGASVRPAPAAAAPGELNGSPADPNVKM